MELLLLGLLAFVVTRSGPSAAPAADGPAREGTPYEVFVRVQAAAINSSEPKGDPEQGPVMPARHRVPQADPMNSQGDLGGPAALQVARAVAVVQGLARREPPAPPAPPSLDVLLRERAVAIEAESKDAVQAALAAPGFTLDPATTFQGNLNEYLSGSPLLVGLYQDGVRRDVLGHTLGPGGLISAGPAVSTTLSVEPGEIDATPFASEET